MQENESDQFDSDFVKEYKKIVNNKIKSACFINFFFNKVRY